MTAAGELNTLDDVTDALHGLSEAIGSQTALIERLCEAACKPVRDDGLVDALARVEALLRELLGPPDDARSGSTT